MAFGEKQQKINELQGQVDHLDAELTGLKPWIGLAQAIREAAAGNAATMDLDTAIGLAVHDTAEEQRQALVMAAFNRLDPERQLEMLVSTFGDDVLKEALQDERERRLSMTDSTLAIDLLVREAREHRRVKLADIPPDAKVELFFYSEGVLDGAVRDKEKLDPHNKADWKRRIQGVVGAEGVVAVHDDMIVGSTFHSHEYYTHPDHSQAKPLVPGSDEHENAPLYFGVTACIPGRRTRKDSDMELDLGPIFVNGVDIFDVTTSGQ